MIALLARVYQSVPTDNSNYIRNNYDLSQ